MLESTKGLLKRFFGEGDVTRRGKALGQDLKDNPKKPAPFR